MNRTAAAFLLAALVGCSAPPSTKPSEEDGPGPKGGAQEKPVAVSPGALFDAYGEDLPAADSKYLNKVVELSGVKGTVEKDAAGRYVLVLLDKPRVILPDKNAPRRSFEEAALNAEYKSGVAIYLKPNAVKDFAGTSGKPVTVRGKCKGRTRDEGTFPDYFVVVEDCVLVPDGKD